MKTVLLSFLLFSFVEITFAQQSTKLDKIKVLIKNEFKENMNDYLK